TPCVYPLIPITVGYIGANSAASRLKGFNLSLVYITGIAVTYSMLGLAASVTGQIFGRISAHPLTNILVGAIVIIFGLSMVDVLTLRLPTLSLKFVGFKKGNYLSTFFLGLVSGLVIAPCLSPALAAILAYLTTKKNVAYGMMLLFSFAYGMGLILLVLGTFSSIITAMPKPGKWLEYIKWMGAFVLIVMGAYLIFTGIRRL
ncbi:MAG: sulfite exporter TauE/SafE family protein, partial [Candidatus Omnitrophica bacterium]|nr:sulfite exporter TauE/SafE family protein [Candidatus Omnitrophota bacterium]